MAFRPSRTIWWSSTITTVTGPRGRPSGVRWSMSGTVPAWRSRPRFEQVPEQQELGDGQRLAAISGGVLAQLVRQGRVGLERQLLPDRLFHDPDVLPGRVAVHMQGVHRAAVAVPDQLQVYGPPVIVGEHMGQFRVLDGRPEQDLRGQRGPG